MTDKETLETPEGSTDKDVNDGDDNAPDVASLQASNKELAEKFAKLTNQYEAQSNAHNAELRKLRKEADDTPKEDTDRIATLELNLARSEAVAEFGLDRADVAMFRGTPDDIREQAEHFASKLTQKKSDTINKTDKEETPPETPPVIPPKETPKPKGKELSTLERYKKGTPEERRVIMERAMIGDIDLAK